MNHIYKSIFNKALGVFTAVPEFASAHGKGSERTVVGRVAKGTAGFAASALAISVGLALTSTSAVGYPGIYINDRQAGNCVAINDTAVANLGVGTILDVNSTPGSVELKVPGTYAPQTGITPSYYNAAGSARPCVAVGGSTVDNRDTQTNRTLFYGGAGATTEAAEVNDRDNGAKNLTLGGRLDVNSGIIGVGDRGVNGLDATNSIRMGMGTALSDDNKKTDAVTIGVNAGASAKHATAIGSATTAKTGYSTALGYKAQAGDPAVTLLNGEYATAIGGQAKALNAQATAVGAESVASGVGQTSIGAYAGKNGTGDQVRQSYGVFIGRFAGSDNQNPNAATEGGNNYGVSIGESAGRYGQGGTRNTAIGEQAGQYLKGSHNIAMGTNAGSGSATDKLEVSNTTAIGNAAKTLTDNSISIGANSKSGKADAFGGENSIAIGNTAEAMGTSSMAMGFRASTSNGHDSIALGTYATTENQKATVIGSYSAATGRQSLTIANNYDSKNLKPVSVASGARATVIGAETTVSGDNSVAIGDTNTVASARTYALGNNINAAAGTDDSLAFGTRASVQGANTIAVGNTAQALTDDSISIGRDSKAGKVDKFDGKKSIAIGYASEAMGSNAIALGSNAATNNGHDSIAMGTYAKTNGEKTISIGAYNTAEGAQSIVIAGNYDASTGSNRSTTTAAAKRAIVVGPESHATAEDAVAIGNKNTIASARTYAMGNNINVAAGADDSLAFGTRAHVSGANQVSIGTDAGADNTSAGEGNTAGISIGNDAGRYATAGKNNTSIGQRAGQYANGDNNVAIGKDAGSLDAAGAPLTTNTVSIGSSSKVKGQEAIAVGNEAEAISNSAIAIGNSAKGRALYSTAIGLRAKTSDDATMTFGESATAVGHAAAATRYSAAAFGHDSFADGESSVALGYAAKALGTEQIAIGAHAGQNRQGTQTGANFSVAIGRSAGGDAASALGNHSGVSVGLDAGRYLQDGSRNTAVGGYAGQYVKGSYNVALGHGAGSGTATEHLEASETISIGHNSKASAAYSTAIGTNANAAQANSVALGAGSTTSDVHTGDYTLNGSYTAAGLPKVANGTVSVGAVGKERQIQNVAAGVISATSTDAINGSQLYATNNYLSNLAGGVKNVLGGDAAVDNAGNVTMSNIGGTGKGNVNDAIAAANTKVAAGNNITVTPTTNADGSKTYTVATTKDLVVDSVKAGDTTVNKDGVTIAGGPSVKKDGINAGDKKITGVADGNVAAGSTDAVNGGQLAEVKAKADSAVQDVVSSNPTALTANKVGNTVTLTPNFIAGDLVNADGTVNTPATADEGKLVSAKTVADALKANHFVVDTKANGGAVDAASEENAKVGSGNKVTFEAGKNLVAQQTNTANGGATVNYKLSDTLENLVSVKSAEIEAGIGPNKVVLNNNGVKVGDSTLNDKGLTINNGPSVTDTGIDAGNKKITGVADGNVAAGSTDAVNGGQLAAVKAKADTAVQDIKSGDENALTAVKDPNTNIVTVTPKLSGDLVDANGNITAPTTPADKGKLVTAGTVAEALANTHFVVDTKATDGELDAASQADQKIKASNKVTLQAGKNLKAKQTNGANGAEVEFSLKDSISLKEVKVGEGSANEVVLNNNGVNVAGNTYINKDGLNANDKKITNVAPGAVTAASKDAVNGSQLYNVANNVKDLIGPDAAIDPATGKVTVADPAKGIGETGKGNIGDAIKHVNDLAKNAADTAKKHTTVEQGDNIVVEESTNADGGKHYKVSTARDLNVDSVKAGDTTVNNDGVTIAGGPSVTKGGINAGGNTITNVADGVNDTDAVNKGQLDKVDTKVSNVAQNVVNVLGGDAAVNGNGDITMSNIGETGKGNINEAIKSVNDLAKKAAAEKTSVKAKEGRSNVTVTEGVNAAGGHEYTVDVERSVTNAGSDYVTVTNNHDADSNTTTYTVDVSAKTKASLAKADSAVQGLTSKDGNLNFTKGANGNVEVSFNDNLNVKNVTTDRVQVANGPSMSKDGINAAGKAISNVANGNVAADSKDAVNGGQLHETAKSVADVIGGGATVKDGKVVAGQNGIGNTGQNTVHGAIAAINQNTANNFNQIRGDLRKMDRDLRGGIAGALATAGLPQAFRPGKSMVAAAASTYRGQSGLAIGVSRISDNGKVILKVTGNTNSRGDFGGTIGAGYQW